MFSKETSDLLQKSLQALPLVVCNRNLKYDIDDLVAQTGCGKKLAIIYDNATASALGNRVHSALKGRFETRVVTLPASATASDEMIDYIRAHTGDSDALIAVGSGTINDLCKYASFLDTKPYILFPSAASMNGYLSANASITVAGYKKTLKAHMPKAVFCDLSVIADAPVRLNKSGLGDSLARPTAQFDWMLSHAFLCSPYNDVPFALLEQIEGALWDNARGIAMRDPASLELLMHTLLLSGLGMTIAGGSYPASGAEHMVAHAYGMLKKATRPTFHGEEIGVTTLTIVTMQEQLLKSKPRLCEQHFPETELEALFGAHITSEAKKAYGAKFPVIPAQAGIQSSSINNKWETIAAKLEKIMLPSAKILSILKAAEAPVTPEVLGWERADYDNALTYARFLRDRFTVLDLI